MQSLGLTTHHFEEMYDTIKILSVMSEIFSVCREIPPSCPADLFNPRRCWKRRV